MSKTTIQEDPNSIEILFAAAPAACVRAACNDIEKFCKLDDRYDVKVNVRNETVHTNGVSDVVVDLGCRTEQRAGDITALVAKLRAARQRGTLSGRIRIERVIVKPKPATVSFGEPTLLRWSDDHVPRVGYAVPDYLHTMLWPATKPAAVTLAAPPPKIGDVVTLQSGGTRMTIVEVFEKPSQYGLKKDEVRVAHVGPSRGLGYTPNTLQYDTFPIAALKKAE